MFEVYSLLNLTPDHAKGCLVWDQDGTCYLDLYGGHAVISVGHSHPHYIESLTKQLGKIGFYSNAVHIAPQKELAQLLGTLSGYERYQLFLVNSGAEANENAIKLASFYNGKKKVLAFSRAFHGRTSVAVAATDNRKILAPVNETENVVFADFNDEQGVIEAFKKHDFSSVIVEGVQGVGGVQIPSPSFLKTLEHLCKAHDALLILDEVQSGYGRTGKFFAHQWAGIKPDIISMAKGMGNGFPIGGILIAPKIKPQIGMLGTTFGGNYLACAAAKAVLEIMEAEQLMTNALEMGTYLVDRLSEVKGIKAVRAKGLMVGIELHEPCASLRQILIEKYHILTGNASEPHTLRVLPSLTITKPEIDQFITALITELND